jgi:endogenous inhibitor of DNA gyrase (YacG/DUF329 family)
MTTAQKQRIEFLRCNGWIYAAIADDLGISENTVKSYCRRNSIGIELKKEHPTTLNTCANCGYPLAQTPGAKRKRFCCDKCRMAWWKAHPEVVSRKAIYRFVCPTCGRSFEAYGHSNRKYCSRACFGVARKASS